MGGTPAMTCNSYDDAVPYALMVLTRNFLYVHTRFFLSIHAKSVSYTGKSMFAILATLTYDNY